MMDIQEVEKIISQMQSFINKTKGDMQKELEEKVNLYKEINQTKTEHLKFY